MFESVSIPDQRASDIMGQGEKKGISKEGGCRGMRQGGRCRRGQMEGIVRFNPERLMGEEGF